MKSASKLALATGLSDGYFENKKRKKKILLCLTAAATQMNRFVQAYVSRMLSIRQRMLSFVSDGYSHTDEQICSNLNRFNRVGKQVQQIWANKFSASAARDRCREVR